MSGVYYDIRHNLAATQDPRDGAVHRLVKL